MSTQPRKTKPTIGPSKVKARQQCGAIPIRHDPDGQLRVLLVTSRETRRWVIPKGWAAGELTLAEAAAREALEEAGVIGRIDGSAQIGSYSYEKRLAPAQTVLCDVAVFLLAVEPKLDTWPEKNQREARWFSPAAAAELVKEPELTVLLLGLTAHAGD